MGLCRATDTAGCAHAGLDALELPSCCATMHGASGSVNTTAPDHAQMLTPTCCKCVQLWPTTVVHGVCSFRQGCCLTGKTFKCGRDLHHATPSTLPFFWSPVFLSPQWVLPACKPAGQSLARRTRHGGHQARPSRSLGPAWWSTRGSTVSQGVWMLCLLQDTLEGVWPDALPNVMASRLQHFHYCWLQPCSVHQCH